MYAQEFCLSTQVTLIAGIFQSTVHYSCYTRNNERISRAARVLSHSVRVTIGNNEIDIWEDIYDKRQIIKDYYRNMLQSGKHAIFRNRCHF